MNPFYDKCLATEGDIFEECCGTWTIIFMFGEFYDATVKLEQYTILSNTIEFISGVA